MPDLRPFMQGVAASLGTVLKSFFLTAAAMSLVAVGLAGASYTIAADGVVLRGALAALIALTVCAVLGVLLSWKRALGAGVLQVVSTRRLVGSLVAVVFDRVIGVSEQGEVGARGGRVALALENVPLNDAVKRVRLAVIHQVRAAPQGGGFRGFLRRKIETRLLHTIERFTLARFRDEARTNGGIDLVKVRDELAAGADNLLAEHIAGAMLKVTLLLTAVAVIASVGIAFGIQQIPFG